MENTDTKPDTASTKITKSGKDILWQISTTNPPRINSQDVTDKAIIQQYVYTMIQFASHRGIPLSSTMMLSETTDVANTIVNAKNLSEGILASEGLVLLYNLVFICSGSLLGVMFYLLKTISDKIKNYTLLPMDAIEVNATIIIGVISEFIISELFTFDADTLGGSIETQKMTLALLGGFASDAMFSVLKGMVNKMKALFSSSDSNMN